MLLPLFIILGRCVAHAPRRVALGLVLGFAVLGFGLPSIAATDTDNTDNTDKTDNTENPVHATREAKSGPARIISLNPSLTAILLSLGEGERLVGVDDFSAQQIEEVAALPKVGGLFNPSLEAVVALEPDLVVLVPSAEQRDFHNRLTALDIKVETFDNHQFVEVLENISRLGALTGTAEAAAKRVAEITATRRGVTRSVKQLGRASENAPVVAIVLQRDPLYVVGGGNFIDTMLQIVGARNVAAEYRGAYPRVSMEWFVAASPEMIIDLSPEARVSTAFWKQWPNMQAVLDDRLMSIDAALISMPGPALDASIMLLASSIWGDFIPKMVAEERAKMATEKTTQGSRGPEPDTRPTYADGVKGAGG